MGSYWFLPAALGCAGSQLYLRGVCPKVGNDDSVHGSPEECREKIQRYVENGVHTPALALTFPGEDLRKTLRGLAPV